MSQRYEKRKGGYCRVIRAGFRYGDDSPMAIIELVDRDFQAKKVDVKKKIDTVSKEKEQEVSKNKDSENFTYEEGCLSVPNYFAEIERPKKCEVEYLDYNGQKQIIKTEGLLSTCIQHEVDHLEGILFIDYLSKLKKTMIVKKLSKQKDRPDRIIV